jgi:hypothetical protein
MLTTMTEEDWPARPPRDQGSRRVPLGRAIQRSGSIVAVPILGGLHHRYVRT